MTRIGLTVLLTVALVAPAPDPGAAQAPASPGQPPAPSPVQPPPPSEPATQVETGKVPYQQIEVTGAHRAGAAALNVIYVPGKVITCGAGIGVAAVTMLATLGSQYPWAVRFFEEGCGYPWYLKPEHVAGQDPRDER